MRLTPCLLALTCTALLAACGGEAPPAVVADASAPVATAQTPAPVEPAPTAPADALDGALRRFYGADARVDGTWTTVPADRVLRTKDEAAGSVTRSVCARGEGATPGELLVAVCGQLADFGHPTPGPLDLLIVPAEGARDAAAFAIRDIGASGHPGEVTYHRFGARMGGFEVVSGFTAQGMTAGMRRLFLPRNGRFEEVAYMRSLLDTAESCTGAACDTAVDVTFAMRIDTLDRNAAVYPLDITEEGRECGRAVARHHTLTFDPGTFRYVVPDSLKRDGCSAPAAP